MGYGTGGVIPGRQNVEGESTLSVTGRRVARTGGAVDEHNDSLRNVSTQGIKHGAADGTAGSVLGADGVRRAVGNLPLSEFSWRSSRWESVLQRFRAHALTVGRAAVKLASQRAHPDDILVAALLHDVGKLVLVRAHAETGFEPLVDFPDFHKPYDSSELFPLFKNRVLTPGRKDFDEYLRLLQLHGDADPIEILSVDGGYRATDSFEVFPKIERRPVSFFSR